MGSADRLRKIVTVWILSFTFSATVEKRETFRGFLRSDLFLMGESECDAERGTAKISLGFHKILKIQCVPCTNPMSALQQ